MVAVMKIHHQAHSQCLRALCKLQHTILVTKSEHTLLRAKLPACKLFLRLCPECFRRRIDKNPQPYRIRTHCFQQRDRICFMTVPVNPMDSLRLELAYPADINAICKIMHIPHSPFCIFVCHFATVQTTLFRCFV